MTARQKRRMAGVLLVVIGTSIASALALSAFRDNLMFFYAPSEIAAGDAPLGHLIRLGGLVEDGTFIEDDDTLLVRFKVTDTAHSVAVEYTGMLPDLFREGQGVVAHGRIGTDGIFRAEQVLARHDENYMAPEVAAALKAQGYTGHSEGWSE
ncbi:cytochrome c-type biogenesis protein CcmE [Natronocella acetinitrilica]|jgi:cytochrome c-type biogenesis protein CcmE|uniref:Cytochrome c-type biogenesis protein CcmE n=1 Tax=Natronocella acetinitrilica TaxID=414046 RepID=A0AAE3G4S5_9GAMM|nr:cytochrome c maturation protein CcmE [Natronocella acetinitrilica]MCP1675850.1 cytochrome c-type biogenesis protein CcmE [Natronocella acetinitrilica]